VISTNPSEAAKLSIGRNSRSVLKQDEDNQRPAAGNHQVSSRDDPPRSHKLSNVVRAPSELLSGPEGTGERGVQLKYLLQLQIQNIRAISDSISSQKKALSDLNKKERAIFASN